MLDSTQRRPIEKNPLAPFLNISGRYYYWVLSNLNFGYLSDLHSLMSCGYLRIFDNQNIAKAYLNCTTSLSFTCLHQTPASSLPVRLPPGTRVATRSHVYKCWQWLPDNLRTFYMASFTQCPQHTTYFKSYYL